MNRDVFASILAMDSYNRDYGAGLKVTGKKLGSAQIISRQSLGISDTKYNDWQAAGFYAIAYDWNGEKVISFRGTNPEFSLDSVDGFAGRVDKRLEL